MEPRPQNARPRLSSERTTRTPVPPTSSGSQPVSAPAPTPVPPPDAGDPYYGGARPEPPRYGPDPYAPPPPATLEGAYPAYTMSEPVPRRGSARRALLRGGLVLLMLALIAGAVAAALDRDLIDDDGFFGGNDEIATRTPAPVANVAAATPIATPRQVAAARPTATRSPATVTPRPSPTVAPADAEATETVPSRRPTSTPAGARGGVVDLEAMLPTSDEVPGQLPEETTAERNADDVALSFGDDAEAAAARLEEWGWSQNLYRNFVGDEATADPASVTTINVSLHRFDSDTSAAAALTYFSDTAAAGGLTDAEIEPIGENSRALIGGETGSNLAAVYVQKGPVLIRVGTFSPAGEALPAAIEVAQTVAAK